MELGHRHHRNQSKRYNDQRWKVRSYKSFLYSSL